MPIRVAPWENISPLESLFKTFKGFFVFERTFIVIYGSSLQMCHSRHICKRSSCLAGWLGYVFLDTRPQIRVLAKLSTVARL